MKFPLEFVTLGGATTTVTEAKDRFNRTVHPSRCECGWEGPTFLANAVKAANEHAGRCRLKPRRS